MKLAAAALLVLAQMTLMGGGAMAQPASPRDALMAADRAFSNLSASRGRAYAFLAMASDTARLLGNGAAPPVYGRAQAFRALARRERGRMSWEPQTATVSSDGRMGWTDGRWTLHVRTGRTGKVTTGHYLTVWTKDRRGVWKVQANMNTTDPTGK